jgi:hypothetical protein
MSNLPSDHQLATRSSVSIHDVLDERLITVPRSQDADLHDRLISAYRLCADNQPIVGPGDNQAGITRFTGAPGHDVVHAAATHVLAPASSLETRKAQPRATRQASAGGRLVVGGGSSHVLL